MDHAAEEIISNAASWLGSRQSAEVWFEDHSIPAFGGLTPKQLVIRGDFEAVKIYLEHLASGGYA